MEAEEGSVGDAETQPADAERWLDRFGRSIGERGRYLRLVLRPDAPSPSDPQRLLEHTLVLDNASFRLGDVVPGWTRYLILDFRYSAVSDEKRDGMLQLGVNLATSALPDAVMGQMALGLIADPADVALPADAEVPRVWERRRLFELVDRALYPRLDTALAPFVKLD